jgi:type II secretory pathway pseudopilin PulG
MLHHNGKYSSKPIKIQEGFTLLEVMIAGFLFSIIIALVAGFAVFYFRNYSFSFEEQQQVGQISQTLTQMIREIRRARQGEDGSWPLVQTDNTTLVFYADTTGDGKADRIRYYVDGTSLKKGVIIPSGSPLTYVSGNEVVSTVLDNINATSSAIFTYYNGNYPGDQVNNPLIASQRILNTQYITIALTMNISNNFAAGPYTMTGGAEIRSLKNNL